MTLIAGYELKAGQSWRYNAPVGYEASRLVVGAIATFADDAHIICVSIADAPQVQPDGSIATVSIPFVPMSEAAFAETVEAADAEPVAALDPGFAAALAEWRDDPRGLTCFTVPFDGYLDRLIARQMAAIVGADAA